MLLEIGAYISCSAAKGDCVALLMSMIIYFLLGNVWNWFFAPGNSEGIPMSLARIGQEWFRDPSSCPLTDDGTSMLLVVSWSPSGTSGARWFRSMAPCDRPTPTGDCLWGMGRTPDYTGTGVALRWTLNVTAQNHAVYICLFHLWYWELPWLFLGIPSKSCKAIASGSCSSVVSKVGGQDYLLQSPRWYESDSEFASGDPHWIHHGTKGSHSKDTRVMALSSRASSCS